MKILWNNDKRNCILKKYLAKQVKIKLPMRSAGMSEEIKPDATIADVLHRLNKPKDYVRGVLLNILKYKNNGMLPVVRIGITGKGFSPYYRIESGDQSFGAFNGESHKPFKNIELHEHTWSTKYMTFEQVQTQMGQLNNWKNKNS
jgi:hypothetical protein